MLHCPWTDDDMPYDICDDCGASFATEAEAVAHDLFRESLEWDDVCSRQRRPRPPIDTLRIDTIDKPTDFTALGEIFVDLGLGRPPIQKLTD